MKFPTGVTIALNQAPPKTRHQLLEQLDFHTKNPGQKLPEDTERLLRSQTAFAAVFLAAGWAEAALQLPHDEVIPDGFPEWVAFAFTQATRFNRGIDAALEFAARQKPSPTLELLAADILMAGERYGDAILKLTPLAATDSEAGNQAARVIAEIYFRLKQYDEARAAIEAQPRLRQSTGGQELLARIAFQRGDQAAADKIYAGIETESDEAKNYLAKQAFDQKNWARARQLIEELLKKHPDQAQLRDRLEAIAKAEAGK
jgi:tetratricopeptide (TPR) repeat protein